MGRIYHFSLEDYYSMPYDRFRSLIKDFYEYRKSLEDKNKKTKKLK